MSCSASSPSHKKGIADLEAGFRDRLGAVDALDGHLGLQVWRDDRRTGRYLMVTWWDTPATFNDYIRSEAHRCSHARIPAGSARPHGVRVDRLSLVST